MAAGAKDVNLPTFQEQRELFDVALEAAPAVSQISTEQMELRRALGVS